MRCTSLEAWSEKHKVKRHTLREARRMGQAEKSTQTISLASRSLEGYGFFSVVSLTIRGAA
jgi:hypothetical protein